MATLKLWTLTIDSDDGTFTTVSADLAELESRCRLIVQEEWEACKTMPDWPHDGPMPNDWRDAYQVLQDASWDTYIALVAHEVTLPAQAEGERLADDLEGMARDLPEEISEEDLRRNPWLGRIILAGEDVGGRLSLDLLSVLKCGGPF